MSKTKKKLSTISLTEALDKVKDGFEVCNAAPSREAGTDPDNPYEEILIYAELDPILAGLYKEYQNARHHASKLNKAGKDYQPLAEIASDRRDSAWSALCTRLLELRADLRMSAIVKRRFLRHTEEKRGTLERAQRPEKARDKDSAFVALEKREKRQEKRQRHQMEEDFLAGFLLLYIARCWAEKTLEQHLKLHKRFARAA